jgi:PilZ domain-containing protein
MAVMNDASERRAVQRFEIVAQANVASGGDVYVMSVRNISAAGAFLEGRPREHADLAPGVEVEVSLSATTPGMGDDEVINIDCVGRVARVELRTPGSPGGFGIALEPKTAEDRERLEDLLSRLIALPAAQRPASIG